MATDAVIEWPADGPSVWRHARVRPGAASPFADLPEAVWDVLGAPETRPRHAVIDGGHILVLRGVNLNQGDRLEDMVSLRLWLGPAGLVSIAVRRVAAVDDAVAALEAGTLAANPADIVLFIAERLAIRIREAVLAMEGEAADIEEELLGEDAAEELPSLQDRVRTARRQALWLRRHLGPQRTALAEFRSAAGRALSADNDFSLAELVNETQRAAEVVQMLADHGGLLQDQIEAARGAAMGRTSYTLSLVAAIFLPLNLLAAVFGANVGGIPWAETPWGFAILLAVCLAVAIAGTWLLRWRRWL